MIIFLISEFLMWWYGGAHGSILRMDYALYGLPYVYSSVTALSCSGSSIYPLNTGHEAEELKAPVHSRIPYITSLGNLVYLELAQTKRKPMQKQGDYVKH